MHTPILNPRASHSLVAVPSLFAAACRNPIPGARPPFPACETFARSGLPQRANLICNLGQDSVPGSSTSKRSSLRPFSPEKFHQIASKKPVISHLAPNCIILFPPELQVTLQLSQSQNPSADSRVNHPPRNPPHPGVNHLSHHSGRTTFHQIAAKKPVISHLSLNFTSKNLQRFPLLIPSPANAANSPGHSLPLGHSLVIASLVLGHWANQSMSGSVQLSFPTNSSSHPGGSP